MPNETRAALTLALEALRHAKPQMDHYEEPRERHQRAIEAVEQELAKGA